MKGRGTSKHLDGIGDLVVWAPIKQGFIDAFDTVTYETRLRIVTEALFKIRATAREYSLLKPFTDTAERIQSILDFRVAILDTEPRTLLLTVTFDRGWEPYMRLIWRPLGPFLDLFFCNCDGYVTATEHSFEEFAAWVRASQVESDLFYIATGRSIDDVQYMAQIERLQREKEPGLLVDLEATAMIAANPEDAARAIRNDTTNVRQFFEYNQMAIEALVALYRLADFYPPDRPHAHGKFLLQAARDLLKDWRTDLLPPEVKARFGVQLKWFNPDPALPAPPSPSPQKVFDPGEVQGGILRSYDQGGKPITHGCLLLLRVADSGAGGRDFLKTLIAAATWESDNAAAPFPEGHIHLNVALTLGGLARLGVAQTEIDKFPKEFRDGMEARASLLGDVRTRHPRRWTLPQRNWDPSAIGKKAPVELSEVDLVVQLRVRSDYAGHELLGDPSHPLFGKVEALATQAEQFGCRLLSVQSLRRASQADTEIRDHFGLADGFSQPFVADQPSGSRDQVARGEILLGYANDRGDPAPPANAYLDNGSFLVVRKLLQKVPEFRAFIKATSRVDLTPEELIGKLIGRDSNGTPTVPVPIPGSNEFDYKGDKAGLACPFQAHIRRTNPRTDPLVEGHGRPTPRIMRRGMSYGSHFDHDPAGERGIIFMAYNASIAEQFETIQRWVNGGNSSGVASAQSDPIMGVKDGTNPRTFRFHHNGEVERIDIPEPFVELQWGTYLFVPSRTALERIAAGPPVESPIGDVARGEAIIERLLALPYPSAVAAWKAVLEDFDAKDPGERAEGPAVWAAIRANGSGVLRTPYGVLVGGRDRVMDVFDDPHGRYSVEGHAARMEPSFGRIYIGLDKGPQYEFESAATNARLMQVPEQAAFEIAHRHAETWLEAWLQVFKAQSAQLDPPGKREGKIDLRSEFITPVLAAICHEQFGIPDQPPAPPGSPPPPAADFVAAGGWSWTRPAERKSRCPGDFMATSRAIFYPDPVQAVQGYGQEQGAKLRSSVFALIEQWRNGTKAPVNIAKDLFDQTPNNDVADDLLTRNLIGIMTGFLPPADGNLRAALYEWLEEKSFWRVQQALAASKLTTPYARADAELRVPLMRAMQKRPAPDLLWRTVTADHEIGGVPVRRGDKLVIGVVSATMADHDAGIADVYPIFGGKRDAPVHPTHACPGYDFAMGTMLGMLSALLEKGRIEAQPSPLIVKLSDLEP